MALLASFISPFITLFIDALKLPKSMMFVSIQIRESSSPAIKRVALSSGTFLKTSAHMNWYVQNKIAVVVIDVFLETPAGDVPIRSVSLASDGSCLVAGNNKVLSSTPQSIISYICG
jgi:hypothetical protein